MNNCYSDFSGNIRFYITKKKMKMDLYWKKSLYDHSSILQRLYLTIIFQNFIFQKIIFFVLSRCLRIYKKSSNIFIL